MKPRLAVAFLKKELLDLGRRKTILSLYLAMPLLFSLLPLLIVMAIIEASRQQAASGKPDEIMTAIEQLVRSIPEFEKLPMEEAVTIFLLRQMTVMLAIVPMILTSITGSYSIIGEKLERTLEVLLATPLSDGEILFCKIAALGIPAYLATLAGAILGVIGIDLALGALVLPDRTWLLTVFLLCPLTLIMGLLLTFWISSRSTDVQSAQQLAGLLVLPVVTLVMASILRPLAYVGVGLLLFSGVLALLDLWLIRVVRARFDRERILTKWR